jgi:hypothetical protein
LSLVISLKSPAHFPEYFNFFSPTTSHNYALSSFQEASDIHLWRYLRLGEYGSEPKGLTSTKRYGGGEQRLAVLVS